MTAPRPGTAKHSRKYPRLDRYSGQTERQADLLNDLSHGRIDLQEYYELGGMHR